MVQRHTEAIVTCDSVLVDASKADPDERFLWVKPLLFTVEFKRRADLHVCARACMSMCVGMLHFTCVQEGKTYLVDRIAPCVAEHSHRLADVLRSPHCDIVHESYAKFSVAWTPQ